MIPDEVLALFPGSKQDPEVTAKIPAAPGRFGFSSFSITPAKYGKDEEFKQVTQISVNLLDGKVSAFTINYSGPAWPHVDKSVENFVEGTSLPPANQWEAYSGLNDQMKTLTCADFSIRVFASPGGNPNYVVVQDLEADKKLKERRRKAREQASPTPGNQ
jgi:hypothetical protein